MSCCSLCQPLELLGSWEVEVGSLGALGEPHDVVAVTIYAGSHHVAQHEFEVVGSGGVTDEEQSAAAVNITVWHRLADNLERLLLLPTIT